MTNYMFKHLINDDGLIFLDKEFKRPFGSPEKYLAYSHTNKILKRCKFPTWSEACAKIYLGHYKK